MAELLYSAALDTAENIERGRTNLLRCPVYRGGQLVAPTALTSTFSLFGPSDTVIIDAQPITLTSSVAEYNVTTLAAYDYADGWSVLWSLTMPDGVQHTFRNGAAVVMYAGHPALTDGDLYRRNSALNPALSSPITSQSDFQDARESAWYKIQKQLRKAGRRPWLIYDATDLKESHLLLTLALIYEDLATRQAEAYRETARDYRQPYKDERADAKLTLQWAEDANVGDPAKKPGTGHGGFWMLGRGV